MANDIAPGAYNQTREATEWLKEFNRVIRARSKEVVAGGSEWLTMGTVVSYDGIRHLSGVVDPKRPVRVPERFTN